MSFVACTQASAYILTNKPLRQQPAMLSEHRGFQNQCLQSRAHKDGRFSV